MYKFEANKFSIWIGLVWWPFIIAALAAVYFVGYCVGKY